MLFFVKKVMPVFWKVVNQKCCLKYVLNEFIYAGRTFGHHFLKRISFAIIPAAFVVGVITTLLGALTVVSIKGLGVGVS